MTNAPCPTRFMAGGRCASTVPLLPCQERIREQEVISAQVGMRWPGRVFSQGAFRVIASCVAELRRHEGGIWSSCESELSQYLSLHIHSSAFLSRLGVHALI